MISIVPKPLKDCSPPRPKGERLRMTMIGAINCGNGVVLLADGQETITDYAKWSVEKMKFAEINQSLRILMVAAGDADTIEMMWEKASLAWRSRGGAYFNGWIGDLPKLSIEEWRAEIIALVKEITKESIIPYGRHHEGVDLIWVIQDISPAAQGHPCPYTVFRTTRLNDHEIETYYFSGSPILLTQYHCCPAIS